MSLSLVKKSLEISVENDSSNSKFFFNQSRFLRIVLVKRYTYE